MSEKHDWPQLALSPHVTTDSLLEQIIQIAVRARRFETAMEKTAEAEEGDLTVVEDEFANWDLCSRNVFMYTGIGSGRPLEQEDLEAIAEGLPAIYDDLRELRLTMLDKVGEAVAARVLAREPKVEVDEEQLRKPPIFADGEFGEDNEMQVGDPSLTSFDESEGPVIHEMSTPSDAERQMLTGVSAPQFQLPITALLPVRAEEVRSRQVAENKPLPKSGNLGPLLGILPSDWVNAIFITLQLPPPGDEEMTVGSRSTVKRGIIFEHLKNDSFLRQTVTAMGEEERGLLAALLESDGLPYTKVTARWGLDENDGYYWSERAPSGPLARLRRAGLAFVGVRDSKAYVVVPADLAGKLREALAAA